MQYRIIFTTKPHGGYTQFYTDKIKAEEDDSLYLLKDLILDLKHRVQELIGREVISIDKLEIVL